MSRAASAFAAEVNNTFGDRHSYLCATPEFDPISSETELHAAKIFYVSPFQTIAGEYRFRFDIGAELIRIRIDHRNGEEGVVATLATQRRKLTSAALLGMALRRPLTPIRTLGLIYWQALRLLVKRVPLFDHTAAIGHYGVATSQPREPRDEKL